MSHIACSCCAYSISYAETCSCDVPHVPEIDSDYFVSSYETDYGTCYFCGTETLEGYAVDYR